MAQLSVADYFHTRKRTANDEFKITRTNKVQHQENVANDVDQSATVFADHSASKAKTLPIDPTSLKAKVVQLQAASNDGKTKAKKVTRATKTKKVKEGEQQPNIHSLLSNMLSKEKHPVNELTEVKNVVDPEELQKTPPPTPTKQNAMDKIKLTGPEMNIKEIRQKLCRSNRLAELKASMARFKQNDAKLKVLENKTEACKTKDSPGLKAFKSIELEVHMSPQKVQSPEKAYLSPRKDSSARKNLLNLLSPTKNAVSLPKTENKLLTSEKPALTLPYKYRTLAEMFRSIDTVCQIMHNRKEMITFKKLKPAVEELLKRNLTEKVLGQIKHLFPEAFTYKQEKIRGYGTKIEAWELVIEPHLNGDSMTSDLLLERRRKLFQILIDKVKVYHEEFLASLDPPMVVNASKITRWHPEFDIERVPDIEISDLPQPPHEEKFTTGKDVLERAKLMFNCNTRMEAALERLKKSQEADPVQSEPTPEASKELPQSVLKGIPKSLLEKVRQKQAAKALESMTRSDAKDKEVQLYSHLPELARLIRNLFVAEKRSVLPIDVVLEKLSNSIRTFMTKPDIEIRLKTIEKEVPGWLMFHNIRNQAYIKISKDADLSAVQAKLEKKHKEKIAA